MDIYRPNVGIVVFNPAGLVLVARRTGDDGPEIILPGYEWQMPQGGIDEGEDPEAAAHRELEEETGIRGATVLGQAPEWLTYDFPPYHGPPHRLARFAGQRQLWFAMRFEGDDRDIDVGRAPAGEEPEFSQWRWGPLDAIPDLVVPYKRHVYVILARQFRHHAAPVRDPVS